MNSEMQKNGNGTQRSNSDRSNSAAESRPFNSMKFNETDDLLSMNEDHLEGKATKAIEKQTAKIPSGVYLALAIGSMAVSAAFAASSKRKDLANFVGLWAPSFLMLGLYNKIVKTHGSDSQTPA
jgi:hypothetical protein